MVTGLRVALSRSRPKVAALDYADRGIRVNVVAPGTILTHRLEAAGVVAT
jgi:NAD(P)-dependent dehydrogenase (short-subunit alcohol dehydrogenase family)